MMTFSEIKQQVVNMIERSDSAFGTRIEGYINQRYRNIAKRRPWFSLCRQITVQQVAGQNYIILPAWVSQVIDVHQTETPIVLALQRYYNFIKGNVDVKSDTGHPTKAMPVGKIGVKAALPAAGVITVVSDDVDDTTQKVRVSGYNANGVPIEEQLSLNGTSTVTGAVTFSAEAGLEPWFSKDGDTQGIVTVKRSTTTLAELGPKERRVWYGKWVVHPQPIAANNLYLTVKKNILPMSNTDDSPEIEGIEDAIIQGAYAQCLEEKRQFQKASEAWKHYEQEIDVALSLEPVFAENFQDQMTPDIIRDPIDTHYK